MGRATALAGDEIHRGERPTAIRAWLLVGLLSLAAVASYMDRVIISLMVEPITHDLGISDGSFGALQGIAFGVFYTIMALPIGRLVDSRRRVSIVAIGLGVFSIFSMMSGLSRTYFQLLLARIGVGAGEASLTPAGYSLISDAFPPHQIGRAMGVFTMSAFIGTGIAYSAGGAIVGAFTAHGAIDAGQFGILQPWQLTFLVLGLPGLLLAPFLYLFREPARRGVGANTVPTLRQSAAEIGRLRGALVPMLLGFGFIALSSYSSNIWMPAVFIRAHGWSAAEIGLAYGLLYLTFGNFGALFAGWLCDRLLARGVVDAPVRIAAFGFLGFTVVGALTPLVSDDRLALVLLAPTVFLSTLPYPLAGAALQMIVPNRFRGQLSALYITVVNLIGLAIGPVVVGMLSDLIGGAANVRYPLALVNGLCGPLAFICLRASLKSYRAARAALAASEARLQSTYLQGDRQ